MTVSFMYLILMVVIGLRNEAVSISTNEFLVMIIVLLASGIISICSRLDDLKRKWGEINGFRR